MKFLIPVLSFSFISLLSSTQINSEYIIPEQDQDTIVFSLRNDFTGKCNENCYTSIGTNVIISINHIETDSFCTHLFVKCPTTLRLKKGIQYKFIAEHFVRNSCTSNVDTCMKNKMYTLIRKFK